MLADDLVVNGWTTFADAFGNNGYITYSVMPCFVLLYDDDAFHCTGGHGYSWKVYEGHVPDVNRIVHDDPAPDDAAYGFESFDEALSDLESQYRI